MSDDNRDSSIYFDPFADDVRLLIPALALLLVLLSVGGDLTQQIAYEDENNKLEPERADRRLLLALYSRFCLDALIVVVAA